MNRRFLFLIFPALSGAALAATAPSFTEKEIDYFETYVEPLLEANCYECHSHESKKSKGGLILDSRSSILAGGDSGPAAVAGKPDESRIIEAVRYMSKDLQMPPDGMLAEDDVATLIEWIGMGLPHTRLGGAKSIDDRLASYDEIIATHWSLQPVTNPQPPAVKDTAWPASPVDRFILARLEAAELAPAREAGRHAWLRRVSFDLTGLPPSPAQIASFLADRSQQARERVVDRLLASEGFGERWGRHWLDVARFGESSGKSRDILMPHAWRYRDYVYDALNADLPYDQFVREQVAGDLLSTDDPSEADRRRTGTGFLAVGSKDFTANDAQLRMDIVDDQLDVIGQGVLGLTVACARCHDHKFDPIPTRDYYALGGIFRSTETLYGRSLRNKNSPEFEVSMVLGADPVELDAVKESTAAIRKAGAEAGRLKKALATMAKKLPGNWKQRAKRLEARPAGDSADEDSEVDRRILAYLAKQEESNATNARLKALRARGSELTDALAYAPGAREAGKVQDIKVHIRGEINNLGEVVPRGFLSSVRWEESGSPEFDGSTSGRLAFAEWLTDPRNPLTPRVAVNRMWHHLFGSGIVPTVDNFGINGDEPTHPELLDHLAHRFVHQHQWSVKAAIRELVLTRTYGMSTRGGTRVLDIDPSNRLYGRMNRKRLEAEPLRDAMLAVSGALILERPGFGSVVAQVGDGEVGRGIRQEPLNAPFPYRGAYLPVLRTRLGEYQKLFDFPEPSVPSGQRAETNVPAQALYLMNSPFVVEQAEALAKRVITARDTPAARIDFAYHLCYGRPATPAEIAHLEEFLAKGTPQERWTTACQAMMAAAEFRYVN